MRKLCAVLALAACGKDGAAPRHAPVVAAAAPADAAPPPPLAIHRLDGALACLGDDPPEYPPDGSQLETAIQFAEDALAGAPAEPRVGADRDEAAARGVVARAASGDLAGARGALAALSPRWTMMIYDGWLGSAAATACVAIAPDRVAQDPGAIALIEAAEARAAAARQDSWDNRDWRAIAMAWVRLGQPERALAATTHMPGTERADAIDQIVRSFGRELTADRMNALEATARAAVVVTPGAPLVVGADPAGTADVARGSEIGAVDAALAAARVRRGELANARALANGIPANLAVHDRAAAAVSCATKEPIMPRFTDAALEGLIDAGCAENARDEVLAAGERDARVVIRALIAYGQSPVAAEVYQDHLEQWDGAPQAEELCSVLDGLARAGQFTRASELALAQPVSRYPLVEATARQCMYQLIPPMVDSGDRAGAQAFHDALAKR